jgi:signal transduction histidine kinase/CheY-like chemotaxis protein
MRIFQNISIKHKLILIIMFISFVTLLMTSVAFVIKDVVFFHHAIVRDLSSMTQVIGMNSEGALLFNDQQQAAKNLAALGAMPYVFAACIYDRNGSIFATYFRKDVPSDASPPLPRKTGHYFEKIRNKEYLFLFQPICPEKETIGTVFIQYDLRETTFKMREAGIIFIAVMAMAVFCVSFILSHILQGIISAPILYLAQIARTVSQEKDYSIRAKRCCEYHWNEIGILSDGINKMLDEIQKREEELIRHRGHLEEEVASRTAELLRTNEELIRAKNDAENANRAKSEFLANMSHEIRTPMNAVLGFTDLLHSLATDPKQKNYIESIRSSGRSLLTLINDILDLSKIEAGKMELQYEPVDVYCLINEIKHIFSLKIAEKELEFVTDIADDIPRSLLLDEVRLRQVLFNLVGNAVKFTHKGYIRLSATKIYTDGNMSRVELILAVEDTGIGISPESGEKIFDAFKQQEGQDTRQYGGTGLGLAITKRLVEMMGGKISVRSEPGRGSVFEIALHHVPVAAVPVKSKKDGTVEESLILFEKALVLVVDDIATNRNLVREFFQDTPISVIEAEDGDKAVTAAVRYKPDVILMDIRMPVMDGYEATRRIRKLEAIKHIPVIALTASGMKEEKNKTLSSGFDGFLTKPIQRSELFDELAKFITHSKKEAPERTEKIEIIEPVSPETMEKLPELIDKLKNELMRKWDSARKNSFFDEISIFADQVKVSGEVFGISVLRKYGEELAGHVGSFDIENMNATLDAYPKLVGKIVSLRSKGV